MKNPPIDSACEMAVALSCAAAIWSVFVWVGWGWLSMKGYV